MFMCAIIYLNYSLHRHSLQYASLISFSIKCIPFIQPLYTIVKHVFKRMVSIDALHFMEFNLRVDKLNVISLGFLSP